MDIGMLATAEGLGDTFPASLAQTRFWLLDALDPGTPALNVSVRWTLEGPLTPARLEAALQLVIARHEVLRTALVEVDGAPVQRVQASVAFRLRHQDLSSLPDPAEEADRLGEEEARTPFALERPPLLRAALLTLAPATHRLLLTMHHTVCDGWSAGVIASEMMAALRGEVLPELPLQYGDYAEWQQAWLASPALDASREYWLAALRQLPYVTLAPDHEAKLRGRSSIVSTLLPRALTEGMAATAARHGCTLFAVALAALGRVIEARTGAADFGIGTQVAGRSEVELEGLVGAFINTLVLRLDLQGAPDWDERVARAGAAVAGALQHHTMPFEVLTRLLNPPRSRHRSPLFAINLIFQRSFIAPPPGGDVTLVDMPSHPSGAMYDLNFFMVERPDGWRASCEYDAALFERQTAEALLAEWRQAMSGAEVTPSTPASGDMERLAGIWREVLGVAEVGPGDSFFALGGHSLLAARMLAKAEAMFGRRVSMAALFSAPTLGELAVHLRPSLSTLVAVGDEAMWAATLGPVTTVEGLGTGREVTVLGAGQHAPAALRTAQELRAAEREVTLVLVDPAAPERGFWSRLWPGRTEPAFDGRTLLFRRSGTDSVAAWAPQLAGELEVAALPPGDWGPAVRERLGLPTP